MPQPPEQLSSAIKPCPVALFNVIQCPLRDKILLHPTVSSKISTIKVGNIKESGLEGTPQLFRMAQSIQTLQLSTQPVCKLLSLPSHP